MLRNVLRQLISIMAISLFSEQPSTTLICIGCHGDKEKENIKGKLATDVSLLQSGDKKNTKLNVNTLTLP